MKKVVLFFAVSAAVALASCGGEAAQTANQVEDTLTVAVEEVAEVVDSAATAVVDSAAAVVDSAAAAVTEVVEEVAAEEVAE